MYYVIKLHEDKHVLCNWLTCRYRCMMYYVHLETYTCYTIYLHEDIHVSGIGNIFTLCIMQSIYVKIYMYYVIHEHAENHVNYENRYA